MKKSSRQSSTKKNKNPLPINSRTNSLVMEVKVIPRSAKSSISFSDRLIKVKLTAPPVDNKANKALIEFMAKQFSIPRSHIKIVSGFKSSRKLVEIEGIEKKNLAVLANIQ